MTQEVFEQRELAAGQGQWRSTDAHLPGGRVESEIAAGQDVRSFRRPAASQGAEAGEQLGEGEGLDQVVVGADVEAPDPVVDRVASGQQQDRRPVTACAELTAQPESVTVGQHHVEHEDVVDRLRGEPARILERSGLIDGIAIAAQASAAAIGALGASQGYPLVTKLAGGIVGRTPAEAVKGLAEMSESYPEIGALLQGGVSALLNGPSDVPEATMNYETALMNMADDDDE